MQYPSFSLEYELLRRYSVIGGVDEVGRGCLAGPVVACVAIFTAEDQYIAKSIRDSKTMTEKQRHQMAELLKEKLPAYAIGSASAREIDTLGIRRATHRAMLRAYWKLSVIPEILLMDGESATIPILSKTYQYNHGDLLHYSIAAASILAKVYRDTLMTRFEEQHPQYGFDKHKGYGTALHYQKIKEFGISNIHRRSFLH